MTVIQWVSDFSERIKQLQNISQAAASGGAKELKVGKHGPEKSGWSLLSWTWVEKCPLGWHWGQPRFVPDLLSFPWGSVSTEYPRVPGWPVCA